jgi:hypothetical protein
VAVEILFGEGETDRQTDRAVVYILSKLQMRAREREERKRT